MGKRKKQLMALLCALALCGGSDIIRVWADVSEEILPEAAEEVMIETTEEVMPETTEEVIPETTEDVELEDVEEIMPETTEDVELEAAEEVMPESTEDVMPVTIEVEIPVAAEVEDEVSENPAVIVENCSISLSDGSDSGLSIFALGNISFQNCFGDQLEGLAKEIYDTMVDVYVTRGGTGDIEIYFVTPVTFDAAISEGKIVENDAYNEACAKVEAAVNSAYKGLMKDYPQVFWIESLSSSYPIVPERSEVSTSGWKGTIYGCILEPGEFDEKYSEKIGEFNAGVAAAKTAVSGRLTAGASAYDTLNAIHDYLCEELEYNTAALSGGSGYQYAHNVYTVFADNKKVVCEGYAKAFKILCDEFGIPCILATGDGVTTNGTEAHMWNCVKMEDGKWYAVDVTWDDQDPILYNYFLAGKNTLGFDGKTFSAGHISDTAFAYPEIADEKYVPCDHEWETTVTKVATCMEEGSKTKTCSKCNSTVTEAVPKTEHSYGEWTVTKVATCTETGVRASVCQTGGETATETIPKVPHTYGKWILKQAATGAENSVMERGCAVCGEIQTEEIAADGMPVSKEMIAYQVIEGANSTWKDGSSAGIRIRVNGEFEKFQSVWVDGVLVSSDDYTAEKGSTIINLKTSYLATLSKGTHVITVLYEDGYAETAFSVSESEASAGTSPGGNKADDNTTIQNAADSKTESTNVQTNAPKTGDTASLWLYAVILFAGFACIKVFVDKYVDKKCKKEK